MKHYGKYLPWAGNPVKYQSDEIENLLLKKQRLERELNELNYLIRNKESEFSELISADWSSEEIQEAKDKANLQNTES
ncbi:MAG: hypothetical protein QM564_13265 [Bergeyella sp.]